MTGEQLKQRLEYLTKVVYTGVSVRSNTTQQKMIDDINKSHRITEFPPRSIVMAQEPETKRKLAPLFQRPFTVVSRSVTGTYVLRDTTDALLPRNYAASQLKRVTQALDSEDEYYELAAILGHKLSPQGEVTYTVKWKGKQYEDPKYNSELRYEDFHSDTTIRDYRAKLGLANPHMVEKREKRLAQAQKLADQIAKVIQKPVEKLASNKHGPKNNPHKSKNPRKRRK